MKDLLDGLDRLTVSADENSTEQLELLRKLHKLLPEIKLEDEASRRVEEILFAYLDRRPSSAGSALTRMAVNCLGNFLAYSVPAGWPAEKYRQTFERIFSLAKSAVAQNKLLINSCLRAMNMILVGNHEESIRQRPLAEIIQLIYNCLFTGGSGADAQQNCRQNCVVTTSDSDSAVAGKVYQPPPRRRSSSNFSLDDKEDHDANRIHRNHTDPDERLTLNALSLLQTIAKCQPKQLFSFWSLLLIDGLPAGGNDIAAGDPSLLCLLAKHPLARVRVAAALCLSNMFHSSRSYLSIATVRLETSKQAFTSYSEKLGDLLVRTHQIILQSLELDESMVGSDDEQQLPEYLLKCLHEVIQNSPYNRLSLSLVQRLASSMTNLVAAGRSLTGSKRDLVFNNLRILLRSTLSPPQLNCVRVSVFSGAFMQSLMGRDALSTAAIRLLTVCAELFPQQTADKWPAIYPLLSITKSLASDTVVAHGEAEFALLDTLLAHCEAKQFPDLHQFALNSIILPTLLRVDSGSIAKIRQAALETLASCSVDDLKKHQDIIDLVCQMSRDPSSRVRTGATKPLGAWIIERVEILPLELFIRIGEVILSLAADQNQSVQSKACWALANMADSLAKYSNSQLLTAWIADKNIVKLAIGLLLNFDETQRQSQHTCLRGLGSLLQIADRSLVSLFKERVVKCLLRGFESNQMKCKWNACRAVGNALKNTRSFEIDRALFVALSNGLECKNFKVRIQASAALGKLRSLKPALEEEWLLIDKCQRLLIEAVRENADFAPVNRGTLGGNSREIDDIQTVANTSASEEYYRQLLFQQAFATLEHLLTLRPCPSIEVDSKNFTILH